MYFSNTARCALIASITLAALAGCGGSSQMAPTPLAQSGAWSPSIQRPIFQNGRLDSFLAVNGSVVPGQGAKGSSFMDPGAAGKPLVFLSDVSTGNVSIFLQKGKHKMVGQITGLGAPLGIAIDVADNLYISNQDSFAVASLVYAPPYTGAPILTLNGTGSPQGVAVSAKGVVAVMNFCDSSGCEYDVSFYAKNSTTPCVTVALPGSNISGNGAFDRAGNLYLDGQDGPNDFIGEIKGGCKATKVELLKTNNTLGQLQGIQVDKAGRIAILPLFSGIIYTYNPPKHGSLGNPVSTTTLGTAGGGFSFAFLASGRNLYAGIGDSSSSGAYEYDYPAGGAAKNAILFPFNGNVAVSPPLIP
jgi:hypothetical protein